MKVATKAHFEESFKLSWRLACLVYAMDSMRLTAFKLYIVVFAYLKFVNQNTICIGNISKLSLRNDSR